MQRADEPRSNQVEFAEIVPLRSIGEHPHPCPAGLGYPMSTKAHPNGSAIRAAGLISQISNLKSADPGFPHSQLVPQRS